MVEGGRGAGYIWPTLVKGETREASLGLVKLVDEEAVGIHNRVGAVHVHECDCPADGEGQDGQLSALHV